MGLEKALREALAMQKESLSTVARAAKISRTGLSRFAHGKQTLSLAAADRLAEYFSIEINLPFAMGLDLSGYETAVKEWNSDGTLTNVSVCDNVGIRKWILRN